MALFLEDWRYVLDGFQERVEPSVWQSLDKAVHLLDGLEGECLGVFRRPQYVAPRNAELAGSHVLITDVANGYGRTHPLEH